MILSPKHLRSAKASKANDENGMVKSKAINKKKRLLKPSPLAENGSIIRHGRWLEEERLAFLRGLRLFGRGKWKKIASTIPSRDTIQTKTHAQVAMRKLDSGVNIFQELDEIERQTFSNNQKGEDQGEGKEQEDYNNNDDCSEARKQQQQQHGVRTTKMESPAFVWDEEDFESARTLMMLRHDATLQL